MKPNLPVMFRVGGCRKLPDGFDDLGQLFVVDAHAGIKFGQFFGERLVIEDKFSKRCEGADHDEAHLYCAGAVEDGGSHEGTVLREGEGSIDSASMPTGTHRKLR